jgi:transposase
MISMGQLSTEGRMLLLGLCDGDKAVAEAVRACICGDMTEREAAAEVNIAKTTFRRMCERVREGLARVIESGTPASALLEDAA